MTTTATRLLESRLLRDLPSETLEAIERRLVVRRYSARAPVLERGAGGGDVPFILEGRVRVVADSPAGREAILAEIGRGSLVAELAAVDGGPRSASVVAATDRLEGSLDAATFRSILARHPEVSLRLVAELAARVRAADLEIPEFVTTGAVARLCALLLEGARCDPSGRLVVDPLPTREVLAGRTLRTPTSTSGSRLRATGPSATPSGGRVFDLLRDDLGQRGDPGTLDLETTFARAAPAGDYTLDLRLDRLPVSETAVPVDVVIRARPKGEGEPFEIAQRRATLEHRGQELAVLRFALAADGRPVAGSLHSLPKPLRNAREGRS